VIQSKLSIELIYKWNQKLFYFNRNFCRTDVYSNSIRTLDKKQKFPSKETKIDRICLPEVVLQLFRLSFHNEFDRWNTKLNFSEQFLHCLNQDIRKLISIVLMTQTYRLIRRNHHDHSSKDRTKIHLWKYDIAQVIS